MSSIEPGVRSAFVLDDEPQIGTFVCKVLGMIGITARQFADPIHFFTALKLTEPELLVLDLALGQSDAVEIIRQLEVLKFKGKVTEPAARMPARDRSDRAIGRCSLCRGAAADQAA
jgi:DNA-binding response OmpR family regulator